MKTNIRDRLLGTNGPYIRFPLTRFTEDMVRFGTKKIDFVPVVPHFFCGYGEHEDVAPLAQKLKAAGLETVVLTPPAYRCCICAPVGAQRTGTVKYYTTCLDLAVELSCSRLVLDASGACWDIEPQTLMANAAEILTILCEKAEEKGVMLLLAPAMGAETPLIAQSPILNSAGDIAEMLRRVNSSALGVCLDTCVMSTVGESVKDWFDLLGNATKLVRLSDGNYHGYRAWGEGVFPVEKYLQQIEDAGYEGDYSLYMPGKPYANRPEYPHEKALAAFGAQAALGVQAALGAQAAFRSLAAFDAQTALDTPSAFATAGTGSGDRHRCGEV